jgi:hypothetical protein
MVAAFPCTGFPFNNTTKPVVPLTEISPIPFTETEGRFLITSVPVPPWLFLKLVASKTCLSILLTTAALSDAIITSFKEFPRDNFRSPRSFLSPGKTMFSIFLG